MSPEREVLEVDVLFVGAGPAGLAGALHLARHVKREKEAGRFTGEGLEIAVIEKAAEVGMHGISGAVLDPRGIRELIPDFEAEGAPIESPVTGDEFYFLTETGQFKPPVNPPPLQNHGNYVISLGNFTKWLAGKVEEEGVYVFTGFPGSELLYEGTTVVGVRTGDKGVDKNGEKKANYAPGTDIRAKVTILCEGVRGSLSKQLIARFGLEPKDHPQVYTTGVKEIWEMPEGRVTAGRVIHTLGFPLPADTFGGGFIYGMSRNRWAVGFVTGLNARNPFNDPHHEMQRFKTHPLVRKLLEGGKMVAYGAKAIPEGGWYAMPRPYVDGAMLCGDTGGFLNAQRLKGIHLAMKSGMLAAETAYDAVRSSDVSATKLAAYKAKVDASFIRRELWPVRNFHQPYQQGLWTGIFHTGLQMVTGGRGLTDPYPSQPGHERIDTVARYYGRADAQPKKIKFDGELTFDKLSDVYLSGTTHEENQPCHLKVADLNICATKCVEEYGNPCQHFCPAAVYEPIQREDGSFERLQINFSNCVHCKTCDIADPYQIITWVTPEGGDGPNYQNL
jgi:electron-transferring-flavoprotein dehydrogenase